MGGGWKRVQGGGHVLDATVVRQLTTRSREDQALFQSARSPMANRSFLDRHMCMCVCACMGGCSTGGGWQ